MTQDEFRKLQQAQLVIMDEVHRLCEENGIAYYLIAGSALGAVRHGGFIPWDFDIDIGMRRADYDRFREVCLTGLSERFSYRDHTNADLPAPHALICLRGTRLVCCYDKFNPGRENLGIYMDIFPLDGAPSDPVLQERHKKDIARSKKALYRKRAFCYSRAPLKNFLKRAVGRLMFYTSPRKCSDALDGVLRRYGEACDLLGSFTSPYRYEKECMPAAVYGRPRKISFEGREFYVPERVEDYLTRLYGDYMQLPPEEDRERCRNYFEDVAFEG